MEKPTRREVIKILMAFTGKSSMECSTALNKLVNADSLKAGYYDLGCSVIDASNYSNIVTAHPEDSDE